MMLTPPMFGLVARRFGALADENRLRLLSLLREKPLNVTSLARVSAISQPSVTKHLTVLKDAGLVESERRGTQALYRISDATVFELCELVCNGVLKHARQQQSDLKQLLAPRRRRR